MWRLIVIYSGCRSENRFRSMCSLIPNPWNFLRLELEKEMEWKRSVVLGDEEGFQQEEIEGRGKWCRGDRGAVGWSWM